MYNVKDIEAREMLEELKDSHIFVIKVTENEDGSLVSNKTYEEIKQAYDKGKALIVTANYKCKDRMYIHYGTSTDSFFFYTGANILNLADHTDISSSYIEELSIYPSGVFIENKYLAGVFYHKNDKNHTPTKEYHLVTKSYVDRLLLEDADIIPTGEYSINSYYEVLIYCDYKMPVVGETYEVIFGDIKTSKVATRFDDHTIVIGDKYEEFIIYFYVNSTSIKVVTSNTGLKTIKITGKTKSQIATETFVKQSNVLTLANAGLISPLADDESILLDEDGKVLLL